jgi:hypothetical protein
MEVIAGKQLRRPAAELLLKSKIRVSAASDAVCSPYLRPAHYVKRRGSPAWLHSGSLKFNPHSPAGDIKLGPIMLSARQRAVTCCYTSLESMNMRSCALLEASDGG